MYALDNTIYIGSVLTPAYTFGNTDIVLNSAKGDFCVDTIGNELVVDEFSVTVRYDAANYLVYAPTDAVDGYVDSAGRLYAISSAPTRGLLSLAYATPVIWYIGGTFYRKGYIKSVERLGKYSWTLTCMSGVGLLDTQIHPGGLYTSQTFAEVMAEIVGGAFAYTVDPEVGDVPIVGWLPYDTARANLHRLLFATGASLLQGTESVDYTVKYLATTTVSVPDSRIALGGKVAYTTPANRVEITEHGWFATANDTEETLYDNVGRVAAVGQLVVFDAPMYGLTVSGSLTVDRSGVNYAVVSGTGILTGKRYLHITRVIALGTGSGTDSVKTVTDNGLVNTLNSRNVAERVLSYYASAMEVEARILLDGEKCGDLLSMHNSFGEAITAYLKRVSVSVTSVKAARCGLVEGYTPVDGGNTYKHYALIDADGAFTVPAGVTALRLVLAGGGDGGQGGTDGQNGYGGDVDQGGDLTPVRDANQNKVGYVYAGGVQEIALGGEAGEAGQPGRLLIVDADVIPGETLTLAIGAGGAGGASGGGAGTAGSNTTVTGSFGTLSTAGGYRVPYQDPFTGRVLCAAGEAGHPGGNGGQTDTVSLYAALGGAGLPGGDVGQAAGGTGGNGITVVLQDEATASGGGGGGAAYGSDGSHGTDGENTDTSGGRRMVGGSGGDGADAATPATGDFGAGGGGGNGGGAGGNGAGCRVENYVTRRDYATPGQGGSGGAGSPGGNGGGGVVQIYW